MKKNILICLLLLLTLLSFGQKKELLLVGISGTSGNGNVASVPKTYVTSVLRAGGVPVILPMNTDAAVLEKMINSIDALILTGGEDLDPLKNYGEEPLRALEEFVPERDEFDIALIKLAVKRGIPVLGVCRGMQVMNVAFGGTLYQDIPSQLSGSYVKHRQDVAGKYCTHTIIMENGSVLAGLLGVNKIAVNSVHHQSIKDVAPGFKITARALDGVYEAMEMEGKPQVFGVQFHPEGPTSAGIDTFLPVFEYLLEQARTH